MVQRTICKNASICYKMKTSDILLENYIAILEVTFMALISLIYQRLKSILNQSSIL